MSEWISVKDRLPNDYRCILFTKGGCTEFGFYSCHNNIFYKYKVEGGASGVEDVTHWMELPVLAKEKEKKPCKEPKNMHEAVCLGLNGIYTRKNQGYGDSFHKAFEEYGLVMPCIRLEDKLGRLKALSKGEKGKVEDESIRDTLLDLANYAIMTVMELDDNLEKGEKR